MNEFSIGDIIECQRKLAQLIDASAQQLCQVHVDALTTIRQILNTEQPLADYFAVPRHKSDVVVNYISNKDVLDYISRVLLGEDLFYLRFEQQGTAYQVRVCCNLRNCVNIVEHIVAAKMPSRLLDYFTEGRAPFVLEDTKQTEILRYYLEMLLQENQCLRERLGDCE